MSRPFDDLHRRPRRSVPAVVVATVLLVVAVIVVGSAVRWLATGAWPGPVQTAIEALATTAWTSALGWGLGAGLGVLGVVLLGAGLRPGRFASAPLTGIATPPEVRNAGAYLTSTGMARIAERRMTDLDGVDQVTVRVSGRRLRATVRTSLTETGPLRAAVRDAVATRLTECGVSPAPKLSVRTVRRPVRW